VLGGGGNVSDALCVFGPLPWGPLLLTVGLVRCLDGMGAFLMELCPQVGVNGAIPRRDFSLPRSSGPRRPSPPLPPKRTAWALLFPWRDSPEFSPEVVDRSVLASDAPGAAFVKAQGRQRQAKLKGTAVGRGPCVASHQRHSGLKGMVSSWHRPLWVERLKGSLSVATDRRRRAARHQALSRHPDR